MPDVSCCGINYLCPWCRTPGGFTRSVPTVPGLGWSGDWLAKVLRHHHISLLAVHLETLDLSLLLSSAAVCRALAPPTNHPSAGACAWNLTLLSHFVRLACTLT